MTEPRDWERLSAEWRSGEVPATELESLLRRSRRARLQLLLMRRFGTLIAVASLGVVAAALRHAGNSFEAALGVLVGLGIAAVWLLDALNQRRDTAAVNAPPEQYLALRRVLCHRQERFVVIGRLVVLLDLVFLVPWWAGGLAFHGFFYSGQLLSLWLPLALLVGFLRWTVVLQRRARMELEGIAQLNGP